MPYDSTRGVYRYIDEETNFPHQTSGHRAKQILPRRDIAAAQRKAEIEARDRLKNLQKNTTGAPPDALPRIRPRQEDAQDAEEYDDEYLLRQHTSTIRYQVDTNGYPIPPGQYTNGNTRLNVKHAPPPAKQRHAIPPRRSAQQPQPTYNDYDEDEQETQRPLRTRPKIQLNWLVFVGVALLLMIAGFIAFTDLGAWWQNHEDDATYGMPRTYQIDAVVGHNDSNSNPSHFIAINLRGSIYIIEAPGGNISKSRSYFITSEVGGDPNPPVTVKFQDLTHSGHLDMVVSIGDPPTPLIVFLFNNGSQFITKPQ